MDLLAHHAEEPFHALIGGGDQLYCDSIVREPEMQDWVNQTKAENKKNYRLTDEMAIAIDRFFFNHYCQSFRSGAFARANSTMYVSFFGDRMLGFADMWLLHRPMLNMLGTVLRSLEKAVANSTLM